MFVLYFKQTQKVECVIHGWTEAVSLQSAFSEIIQYIPHYFVLVSINSSDSLISGSGCTFQGFVIELLLTLESGIDTLADAVKNYDLLSALAR